MLSNGMAFGDVAAVIEGLKSSSKGIGTHARRELYWDAYTKMASKVSGMDGAAHCFILFRAGIEGIDGTVELVDFTKRQKGLVSGGCDFLGLKLKPPEDPTSKTWCMVYTEEEAQKAWDDVSIGVYVRSQNALYIVQEHHSVANHC